MSDFSPIPLDRVKRQFYNKDQQQFHTPMSPFKSPPVKHNSPIRGITGAGYSPLRPLMTKDLENSEHQKGRMNFYNNDNDSKVNLEKEKEILQMAGYSQKLSTSVLDDLNRRAEKISNELDKENEIDTSPKKKLEVQSSIERRFQAIHKKQFEKMESISNHYSAIRRRKQMLQEFNNNDNILGSPLMQRKVVETEKPIKDELITVTTEKRRIDDSDEDISLHEYTEEEESKKPAKKERSNGTPIKQIKRLSNVDLGSASKRRRTLIGPREVPESFKNSPKPQQHSNLTYDSTMDVSESTFDKIERQMEDILGQKIDNFDNVNKKINLHEFTSDKLNVKKYVIDDKPIEPLRLGKESPLKINKPVPLTKPYIPPGMEMSMRIDKMDQTCDFSMLKRFNNANIDSDHEDSSSDTSMTKEVPINNNMMNQRFSQNPNKINRQINNPNTVNRQINNPNIINRQINDHNLTNRQTSNQNNAPLSRNSFNKNNNNNTNHSTIKRNSDSINNNTTMKRPILKPKPVLQTRTTKKFEAHHQQLKNQQKFSSSKSLTKARELSNSSSSSNDSVFSNGRQWSGSSTSSNENKDVDNDGFVKPKSKGFMKPTIKSSSTNSATSNSAAFVKSMENKSKLHKSISNLKGTQHTLKSARSLESLKKQQHHKPIPPSSSSHSLSKKSSIPRFCQPTVSSLNRQSSKTSLNGYLTKPTIKSSTSNNHVKSSSTGLSKSISKTKSSGTLFGRTSDN